MEPEWNLLRIRIESFTLLVRGGGHFQTVIFDKKLFVCVLEWQSLFIAYLSIPFTLLRKSFSLEGTFLSIYLSTGIFTSLFGTGFKEEFFRFHGIFPAKQGIDISRIQMGYISKRKGKLPLEFLSIVTV